MVGQEERKQESSSNRKVDTEYGKFNFLKEQVGKIVRIEFLIGNSILQERIGILEDVQKDFLILRALETDSLIYCNSLDIKFINIPINNYPNQMNPPQISSRYPYY